MFKTAVTKVSGRDEPMLQFRAFPKSKIDAVYFSKAQWGCSSICTAFFGSVGRIPVLRVWRSAKWELFIEIATASISRKRLREILEGTATRKWCCDIFAMQRVHFRVEIFRWLPARCMQICCYWETWCRKNDRLQGYYRQQSKGIHDKVDRLPSTIPKSKWRTELFCWESDGLWSYGCNDTEWAAMSSAHEVRTGCESFFIRVKRDDERRRFLSRSCYNSASATKSVIFKGIVQEIYIRWENKVLSIAFGMIQDPVQLFEQEDTEEMRFQHIWALWHDLCEYIRDTARIFLEEKPESSEFAQFIVKAIACPGAPSLLKLTLADFERNLRTTCFIYIMYAGFTGKKAARAHISLSY